jgi:hypothetical protein
LLFFFLRSSSESLNPSSSSESLNCKPTVQLDCHLCTIPVFEITYPWLCGAFAEPDSSSESTFTVFLNVFQRFFTFMNFNYGLC